MGGAYQDALEKEQKRKAQVKAEALAAEDAAVYNLREIRKLEQRTERLGRMFADSERAGVLLTRLVERMGHDLAVIAGEGWGNKVYTLIGQAEYDAAMHDAEGPDVKREDCVP